MGACHNALNALGFKMRLLTKDEAETEALVVNVAKAQHEYMQKKKPLVNRTQFVQAEVDGLAEKIQAVRENYDDAFYYRSQMAFAGKKTLLRRPHAP